MTTTNPLLIELGTIIKPLENWAEQELASVGSALLASVGPIFNSFIPAQQRVITQIQAFWQAKHAAAIAAGASEIDAIEQATTASLNEFIAEEGAEFNQEKTAFITILSSAAKQQAAKVESDAVTEAETVGAQVATDITK